MTRPRRPSLVSFAADDQGTEAWRRGHLYLAGALLVTLLLWNVPYGRHLLYPFKVFATWVHESSHAVVMALSGAGFAYMDIYPDSSGLAYPRHGVSRPAQAFISSAGYTGTALFGALLLGMGRTQRQLRGVLVALGIALLLSGMFFVRNRFGEVAIGGAGAFLLLWAWLAPEGARGFVVTFLAAQACLNALLDIRVLFAAELVVNGQRHGRSDAHAMSHFVGGPPWLWAGLWLAWSFAVFWVALRYGHLRPLARASSLPGLRSPS